MKINLNRSQWEQIGKTAGWIEAVNHDVDAKGNSFVAVGAPNSIERNKMKYRDTLQQIGYLMDEEVEIRGGSGGVEEIEEATPEDLDAGFGQGMREDAFRSTLVTPSLWMRDNRSQRGRDLDEVDIMFSGNYSRSSVNAGDTRTVFIDSFPRGTAKEIIEAAVNEYKNIGLAGNYN